MDSRGAALHGLWLAGAAATLAACTFLVSFDDKEPPAAEDAGIDETPLEDAGVTPDAPALAPRDAAGVEAATPFSCTGRNHVAVPGAPNKACCDGVEADLTTTTNCGGCGMTCQSTQTCVMQANGRYYCTGCGNTGGRPSCWTGCCSAVYGALGVCAPNDCDDGTCLSAVCAARGMTCVDRTSTQASYCAYP